jgi:hypothetical protein
MRLGAWFEKCQFPWLQRSNKGLVWSGLARVWRILSAHNQFLSFSAESFKKEKGSAEMGQEIHSKDRHSLRGKHVVLQKAAACLRRHGLLCAGAHCRGSGGAGGVKRGQKVGGEAQVCGALPGGELCERLPLQVEGELSRLGSKTLVPGIGVFLSGPDLEVEEEAAKPLDQST